MTAVETVDAVVVGAGHNGLVAANLLADRGWSVVVLEATATPGGAVQSAALCEPGFVNDVCSAFYPLGAASPVLKALELERWGLEWLHAPYVLAHPASDGACPIVSRDIDETLDSLARTHPDDAASWRRLHDEWGVVRSSLLDVLLGSFPPVRAGTRLAAALRRDLLRFARFAVLPVRRLGEERFVGDPARRLLAGAALHADLTPETPLSGLFGWLLCMLGHEVGFPVVAGGAGRLTDALVARLRDRGGEVRCSRPVVRVELDDGRATGVVDAHGTRWRAGKAVLAAVDAPTLYRTLVGEEALGPRRRADVRTFQWDHATVKIDWTLDRPIPWEHPDARRAGTVHLVDGLDALSRACTELVCREVPARPFVLVGQQSITDRSRQPAGTETAWAYTHLHHGASADDVARLVERVHGELERFAPGFGASIRRTYVAGPRDLQRHDPSLVDGAIAGGTTAMHQQLVFRPFPGTGRPETPVRSLYLASASAHPGGGVHGAPGANAARAALWHDRLRVRRRSRDAQLDG